MEQEDKNLHAQQPDEAQTPAKQPEPKGYEAYLSLFDLVRMLAVITLMFVFFFRVNGVSGSSMYPTLVDKDYLVLESNFLYRNARQGDIVVLYTPPFSDNDELLVKRVIAVGGQTVDIDFNAGVVYVDGQALDERYTFEPTYLSYAEYGKALDYPVTVPESNPEVNYEDFEIPDEDEYIDNNADYDYKDDVDDYDAEEEEPHKKGISHTLEKVMTIGGIVVGAIIICVLVYTIASASGLLKFGSSKNNNSGNTTASDSKSEKDSDSSVKQVEVPDLTNKTPEEAQKTLNDLQLGYKNGGEEASDSVAEGNICRQDVEAGTKVEPYTQITCYISSGTEEIQVPYVTDYSQTDAEAMLKELGLKTAVQKANSSDITIGNVVSTDPEAGTSVKAGDTVTLTISIGEGDTAVRVPNVIGTSEADAKSTLSQLGLLVSVQTGNDQSVNEGEVYKQSVDSGTRVNTGETITIYVRSSSSSDDEDSEDSKTDKNKNKDKDKNSSSSSDGTWKPANSLQQPTNYQGGKVKVELVQTDDDGNTYSDQSMEVDDPQFPLSIQDLNGHPGITSGTVVLYEWIDDSYQIIDQYDVSFRQVN